MLAGIFRCMLLEASWSYSGCGVDGGREKTEEHQAEASHSQSSQFLPHVFKCIGDFKPVVI